jgi:type IV pilus assembly protein PilA
MLKAFHNRMKDDKGFTLIELMVVVLIIAILIAIAIPTFLGLRKRAQDRAAQSNLRNALTAAKAYYTDEDTYDPAGAEIFNAAQGLAIEPSLAWNDTATSTQGQVSVRGVTASTVLVATQSASGDYFCLGDNAGPTVEGTHATTETTTVAACAAQPDW